MKVIKEGVEVLIVENGEVLFLCSDPKKTYPLRRPAPKLQKEIKATFKDKKVKRGKVTISLSDLYPRLFIESKKEENV